MKVMPSGCVDLVVTSPPYALHFKKEYGNVDKDQYVRWFLPFGAEITIPARSELRLGQSFLFLRQWRVTRFVSRALRPIEGFIGLSRIARETISRHGVPPGALPA